MAIKHGNVSISAVKHGSITVPRVDHGSVNVWLLPSYSVATSSNLVGLKKVYLSASSTATSGPSSLNVTSGTTVYGFAVLDTDTYAGMVSGWVLISGEECKQGAIYRTGSKTITAATTFTINLFDSTNNYDTFLFKLSGECLGSWTVYNHIVPAASDFIELSLTGSTLYCKYDDHNGISRTMPLGKFAFPSDYMGSFNIYDSSGNYVSFGETIALNGPYTIFADTSAYTSTT